MKRRRQGISPPPNLTQMVPADKKWSEMSRDERLTWIEETYTWLANKRRREQRYLDRRQKDLKTDRDYRADAIRELDVLARLAEMADEIQGA